jgi:hypothetical protein
MTYGIEKGFRLRSSYRLGVSVWKFENIIPQLSLGWLILDIVVSQTKPPHHTSLATSNLMAE